MISVHEASAVRTITLSRADKKNALTVEMLDQLASAFLSASHTDGARPRVILIQSLGDTFCAGFDMAQCRDHPQVLADMLLSLSRVIRAMRENPAIIVAAVTGAAIAGGCALVAAADYVVTHTSAKLGYPVVRLGISPAVNVPALRLSIGDGMSRARTLDPGLISGDDAQRIGAAHECLSSASQCAQRAVAISAELATKGDALAITKMWLNDLDRSLNLQALDAALSASLRLVGSVEQVERVAALWSKR